MKLSAFIENIANEVKQGIDNANTLPLLAMWKCSDIQIETFVDGDMDISVSKGYGHKVIVHINRGNYPLD